MKKIFLFFAVVIFFSFPKNAFAINEFINLVNPVRVSDYNKNPFESIKAEYKEIERRNLPSTWLITYDVLESSKILEFIKGFDNKQEIGLFLEITPILAKKANVKYNSSDSWHRAKSLFLIGYKQAERIRLIDVLFFEFNKKFGFYPKSVGAWWIDSFSLAYMFKKYGIVANLSVADQYSTDNYSIWGQYWSYPFYPSKLHSGIPASKENKIGVVTIQWAPRDPLNAYGDSIASKYSSQDYLTMGLSNSYLEKLIKMYALKNTNSFGQATFGLEADLPEDVYSKAYSGQLDTLVNFAKENNVEFLTMEKFGEWFREKFQNTQTSLVGGKDILKSKIQSYWFQTPSYRMGLKYNPEKATMEVIDFRVYQRSFREPFFEETITENDLLINIPSVIDTANDPETRILFNNIKSFNTSRSKDGKVITLSDNKQIIFNEEKIIFKNFSVENFFNIQRSPYILIDSRKDIEIKINKNFPIEPKGLEFNNLSVETIYFLIRPKIKIMTPAITATSILVFLFIIYMVSKKYSRFSILVTLVSFFIGTFIVGYLILKKQSKKYIINQSEFDALLHLKSKPKGAVLVEDSKCLVCGKDIENNPTFANIRDYIGVISDKKIYYDEKLFNITDHKKLSGYLDKLNAQYIYINKNRGFENKLKLSPGDYGIRKIYENSSSQIWQKN